MTIEIKPYYVKITREKGRELENNYVEYNFLPIRYYTDKDIDRARLKEIGRIGNVKFLQEINEQ